MPLGGSKLTIKNACEEPIWIASQIEDKWRAKYPNNKRLGHGESFTWTFPHNQSVSSFRFWPKMGCIDDDSTSNGFDCVIGQSGGDFQGPSPGGFGPDVNSKFEGTFNDPVTGMDWWDTSGVDGYTLPYKLELSGCPNGTPLDCSRLTFQDCPDSVTLAGQTMSQRLYHPSNPAAMVGCYSPCAKLTTNQWQNAPVYNPSDPEALWMCCPAGVAPEDCQTHSPGGITQTEYVQTFHEKCPGVYAYSYDDAIGLQSCPPGTHYTWTLFCPQ